MQKNENRPGYKKTKVGWIPVGWKCQQLTQTGLQVIDGDRGNNYPSQSDFFPSEYCLFLNAGNVTSTGFLFNETQSISEKRDALLRKGKLIRGDLVVTTRGTIGNFAHFKDDIPYDHIRINSGMAIIRNDNKKLDTAFVSHYFKSSTFEKELQRVTFGSAIPQLTIGLIQKFPLPISPSLSEQEAIAGVLECWDRGIRKLKNKIEKKRLIKKGLMQRLLAGTLRLPGFSEDWKITNFLEAFEIQKGIKPLQVKTSEYMSSGKHPIVDQGQKKVVAYTDIDKVYSDIPVIVFGDHTRIIKWVDFPFVVGADGTQLINAKERTDLRFGYFLISNLELPALGYSRHLKLLKEADFKLPSVEEQKAIAEVLRAADGEIEALERKLENWRDQKKYLLNNLVTGSIRLPEFRIENGE